MSLDAQDVCPIPPIASTSAPPGARAHANRVIAIAAAGLKKRFGQVEAVAGVDFEVRQGEIVAVLGPNGAGKTSTMDLILGLSHPDAGKVRVFGRTPRAAMAQGFVSAVLQSGGLLKDLTVRETCTLTGSVFAESRPVDEVLARAGITDIADRRVGVCSGGQQQRLRFALALLSDPGLLLLDEPTAGMDVEGRRDFWAAIRADAARGRTVLFATHYLDEADEYADRVILMAKGRIIADGSTAEIKNRVSGRVVQATIPEMSRDALLSLPGVDSVEQQGERFTIHTGNSDAVARDLLTRTAATDLEISAQNLETVFLALTSKGEHA